MGYRHGSRITTQSHPDYGAATWNGMDMEYGIIIIVLYYIVILSFYIEIYKEGVVTMSGEPRIRMSY